jgi:Na+/melibiose symporter-like transporter
MELLERTDFRYSFFDGMCANVYGTLTHGVFLTGFALYLKMDELMIGLLAAIPYLVTLFQLPASYYICRKGRRKFIAHRAAAVTRLLWLPILAVGLASGLGNTTRCMLVMTLYFVLQAFSSVSFVAWLSWTSDLVPDEIRGTFFGTRNMLCGAAGIAAVLLFGNLVDVLKTQASDLALAISVPLLGAVFFGLISLHYLNRIGDVEAQPRPCVDYWHELTSPFRESNFRQFLLFAFCWNFAVYFAAPFFSLYYLRDLKYSYGFVAVLTTVGSVLDLIGMQVWGRISDRVKNKAVIRLAGWGVVFLPALWAMVRPGDVIVPVLLQLISGSFWAGVNLCTSNLLLRISPQTDRVWFISAHSITAGLGAALAPITAGLVLNMSRYWMTGQAAGGIIPMHIILIVSTVLRVLSLQLFKRVHEPQECGIGEIVRSLTGFRRLKPSAVLIQLIGPFTSIAKPARKSHK